MALQQVTTRDELRDAIIAAGELHNLHSGDDDSEDTETTFRPGSMTASEWELHLEQQQQEPDKTIEVTPNDHWLWFTIRDDNRNDLYHAQLFGANINRVDPVFVTNETFMDARFTLTVQVETSNERTGSTGTYLFLRMRGAVHGKRPITLMWLLKRYARRTYNASPLKDTSEMNKVPVSPYVNQNSLKLVEGPSRTPLEVLSTDEALIPPEYGSVGFLTLGAALASSLLKFSGTNSRIPAVLRAADKQYPVLERVQLANAKNPGQEVWQFRPTARQSLFFSNEEVQLKAKNLAKDMPLKWYALENAADLESPTFVIGIGPKKLRIHIPGAALEFSLIPESKLFGTDNLSKPLKERTARITNRPFGESNNLNSAKNLASTVSYKTLTTVVRRVTPEGVDPSLQLQVLSGKGEPEFVRLVLYAIQKRFLPLFGTVTDAGPNSGNITHLVVVWNGTDMKKAFWASHGTWQQGRVDGKKRWATAKDTIESSLGLLKGVATYLLKSEQASPGFMEAELDIDSPVHRLKDVPGEYGSALRLAAEQEFRRDMAFAGGDAVRMITDSVTNIVAGVAHMGVDVGKATLSNAVAGLFGASPEEPVDYELTDLPVAETVQPHPYTKIELVYDQRPNATCVLCSIAASMSMVADVPAESTWKQVSSIVNPKNVPRSGLVMTDTFEQLNPALVQLKLKWRRILPSVENFKKALDSGLPVVVGTTFDGAIFQYGSNADKPLEGPNGWDISHCVTLVAYDDADSTFTILNSWGADWGRNGGLIIEQEYAGFDRAFVLFKDQDTPTFGAVDLPGNLPTMDLS